jgi:hypothetical protein
MACPAIKYYSTFVHNQHELKKNIEQNMCVLSFSATFVWSLFYSKSNWGIYDQKCIFVFMLFLFNFNKTLISSIYFRKLLKHQISFLKIRPFEADLFQANKWAEGRTDMMKLIVAFRNTANVPQNWLHSCFSDFQRGWTDHPILKPESHVNITKSQTKYCIYSTMTKQLLILGEARGIAIRIKLEILKILPHIYL